MIRRISWLLASFLIFGSLLEACQGSEWRIINNTGKGARIPMKTSYLGRFAVEVPLEMRQAAHYCELRYSHVKDFVWPQGVAKDQARQLVWENRVAEIRQRERPRNQQDVVISLADFAGVGEWARGVYYFGNYMDDGEANLDLLVDFGRTGLWIKSDSAIWTPDNKVKIDGQASTIAKSYRAGDLRDNRFPGEGTFHLQHGALHLAYDWQEKIYARFEGHRLKLKLEVELKDTHRVQKHGLLERLTNALLMRFAPGVDVDTIRSRGRKSAGLKGDELVMRMSASGEPTQIHFNWEYRGEVDSGEHPEIQITMEAPDGSLDEKLKVWDAILDSFRPMYPVRQ